MNELESPVSFHVLVPKNQLKQPTKKYPFDTYYGMITQYSITKNKNASGSGRSPSFPESLFYINELKHKFPKEDEILKIIYRKTVYLHILKKEIMYLSERYDWNKGEEFKELFLSRFENFTNSLVELILISINLYARMIQNKNTQNKSTQNKNLVEFKDIFRCIDHLFPYLFSWGNVSGNDGKRLLKALRDNLDIDWAENAEIHTSDDGKTLRISKGENSAEIEFDEKEKKGTLKISDGKTYGLKVKKENGKQNIYLCTYYQSINFSVNLTSYVYIRNCLAHNPCGIKYLPNNQNPILQIENIPPTVRRGNFGKYIEEEFEHYKQLGGKKSQKTYQSYIDKRFSHIEFEFWIQKNSEVNVGKTKIRFKRGIVELTEMMFTDLIRLQKDMFKIL